MNDLTIIIPSLSVLPDANDTIKMKNAERECLVSLRETAPDIPVLVASNGGEPRPLPMQAHDMDRIHIWSQGQCMAVNAAAATVNTEWIMVTNNDMIYPPGWLDEVEKYIDSYDFMCARLVEPQTGAPTFLVKPFGGAGGDFRKSDFIEFVKNNAKEQYPMRTGFNLPFIIRKDIWDIVGGYDVNYDPWGSNGDSDLEYKLKLVGVQPMQNKNWLVYHFSQTSGTFHPSRQNHWNKNFAYFEEKWGFPRTDEGIWEATFEIPGDLLQFRPKWASSKYVKTASEEG